MTTDRFFFSEVNRESRGVLEYAGVDVSQLLGVLLRMFIHFDVGMGVESLCPGEREDREWKV